MTPPGSEPPAETVEDDEDLETAGSDGVEDDEGLETAGSDGVEDDEGLETAGSIDVESLVEGGPILLFDGVCNLCNGTIRFVIDNDPEGEFRFAPLQSASGQALLDYADVDVAPMESFVMVDGDDAYVRSAAALRTAARLGLPWSLAKGFLYVPRAVRDGVYRVVARYRYEVFGRKDRCMVPQEDVSDRFLD